MYQYLSVMAICVVSINLAMAGGIVLESTRTSPEEMQQAKEKLKYQEVPGSIIGGWARKEWESMKEVANDPKYQAIDKENKANYASCQGCYRVIKEEGVSWDVKDRYISHLTIECTSGWSKGKMHHPYLRKDGVYENYGMLETRTFSTLDKYATAHCDR
jgi:hypothetical protein